MDEGKQKVLPDFHSPEFNRVDGLDDLSGNCLLFEPLGDTITADMRHRAERLRSDDNADISKGKNISALVQTESDTATKDQTENKTIEQITVVSRGRTLIIDTDKERAMACKGLLSDRGLDCTVLITGRADDGLFASLNPLGPLEVDRVSVRGAFGRFSATAKGDQKPLAVRLGKETAAFDLVLDLQRNPSYTGESLPLGYYAPGSDPAALEEALGEMPEMRGQFKKPRFVTLRAERCFHGGSRSKGCDQCVEICPFGAIRSVSAGEQGVLKGADGSVRAGTATQARRIDIDHYLCQGCGGCVLICPADAIELAEPPREAILDKLRIGFESMRGHALPAPELIISDVRMDAEKEPCGSAGGVNEQSLFFGVEQISQAGLDILLSAFALGAGNILVACGAQNPSGIRKAVECQVEMARAVLKGLGLPEDACRFVAVSPDFTNSHGMTLYTGQPEQHTINLPGPSPAIPSGHDRRTVVRTALQHLHDRSGRAVHAIPLRSGAPFGTVGVGNTCTLCMACASACPTGALSAGGDHPRLSFRESLCHQCGLCSSACPEHAIQTQPRLLCDVRAAEETVILRETEPFRCIECGLPFASPAIIERMKQKLAGHWMYANERQLRRLQMCVTCRTRDAFTSRDVRSWNRS